VKALLIIVDFFMNEHECRSARLLVQIFQLQLSGIDGGPIRAGAQERRDRQERYKQEEKTEMKGTNRTGHWAS
jgi:hypothetical protein